MVTGINSRKLIVHYKYFSKDSIDSFLFPLIKCSLSNVSLKRQETYCRRSEEFKLSRLFYRFFLWFWRSSSVGSSDYSPPRFVTPFNRSRSSWRCSGVPARSSPSIWAFFQFISTTLWSLVFFFSLSLIICLCKEHFYFKPQSYNYLYKYIYRFFVFTGCEPLGTRETPTGTPGRNSAM